MHTFMHTKAYKHGYVDKNFCTSQQSYAAVPSALTVAVLWAVRYHRCSQRSTIDINFL